MKAEDIVDKLKDTTEVVSQYDKRLTELEKKGNSIPEYPKIFIPDYTKELKFLNKQIEVFIRSDHQQGLNQAMKSMEQKIDSIPKQIKIKTSLDFGAKHWTVKVGGAFAVLILIFGSWLAISRNQLIIENESLLRDTTNYFYVKALYPQVIREIEYKISTHPATFKKLADSSFGAQGKIINKIKHHKKFNK
jgi:hypothetical protein